MNEDQEISMKCFADEEKTEVQRMARILEDAMDEENKAWNVEKVISYK